MSVGTGISNYAELKILDHMLGTTAWTMPASGMFMALGTDTTPDDETFTELLILEVADPFDDLGYDRQAVAFEAATSPGAAQSSSAGNTSVVTFGPATHASWGSVKSFALFDAATAGNMICYGALSSPVTIDVGDKCEFGASAIVIQLD